jgi:hypothetical protein
MVARNALQGCYDPLITLAALIVVSKACVAVDHVLALSIGANVFLSHENIAPVLYASSYPFRCGLMHHPVLIFSKVDFDLIL